MTVYKVVLNTTRGYRSTGVPPANRKLYLKYDLGKTTEAPVGGIFCFKTFRDARRFYDIFDAGVVSLLVCQARKADIIPTPDHIRWWDDPLRVIRAFWNGKIGGCSVVPTGTIILKKITPLQVFAQEKGKQK